MSISNEIQKLQTNLTNSYEACSDKGATMPASQNFDNLADCIDSIPTGSTLKRTFVLEEEINYVNTSNITATSAKLYNYERISRVVDNNGVLSDFSADKYVIIPQLSLGSDYEINFTFTPADFDDDRPIISTYEGTPYGEILIGSGTGLISLWDKTTMFTGVTQMSANSKYSFKLVKNGSALDMYLKSGSPSEDISDYTLEFSGATDVFNSRRTVKVGMWGIGNKYFTGTIDMNECYIKWDNYIQWYGVPKSTIIDNYSMTGHVKYDNGVLSNFFDRGTNFWAYAFSTIPDLGNNPWELECEFTVADLSYEQEIIGISNRGASPFHIISSELSLYLSSDGATWDIASNQTYLSLTKNTTYRLKAEWTGTEYKISRYVDGEWNVLTTVTSSTPIHFDGNLILGVAKWSGSLAAACMSSINTNYCILKSNGNIIWQGITQNS